MGISSTPRSQNLIQCNRSGCRIIIKLSPIGFFRNLCVQRWTIAANKFALSLSNLFLAVASRIVKHIHTIGITALVTGLVNYFLFPTVALCGASGVVFAFILLVSFTNVREGEIPITFILVALIYIGQQVYEGIFFKDNVSNLSHILGGVVGAIAGYSLNVRRKR